MASMMPTKWRNSFEQLWDDVARTFERWAPARRPEKSKESSALPAMWSGGFGPAVDVEDADDAIRIRAELPGLEKDDFKVELRGDRLWLRGEKKSEREEKGDGYLYSERSYGAFSRAIDLPGEVDASKAEAVYKNGVLNLTLPKTAASKARRITVKVS